MKKQYNTIELFAGCGGLLEGLKETGKYNTLACVEWEKKQSEILKKRLEDKYGFDKDKEVVFRFDIQRTDELLNGWDDEEYGNSKGLKNTIRNNQIDIITGGPPCQAYSIAGRIQDPNGMKNDYRNYLFESYLKVVGYFKPRIFVFENVEGILTAKPDGFSIIEQIRTDFLKHGYEIIDDIRKYALIDFSEYGVPQKRKRVILVGLRKEYYKNSKELLREFYSKILPTFKEKEIKTVKDAIGDLPKLIPLDKEIKIGKRKHSHSQYDGKKITHHISRYHNKRDIEIFRILAHDIEVGNNEYASIKELQALYTKMTGKVSNIHKYNVLRWDRPSNTIPAHLKKDGLRHIHPDSQQARTITVREAARIQTFPDDFMFSGVMTKDFEMIGNAVPPLFSKKLGQALSILLEK